MAGFLVTGGTGFIGSALTQSLSAGGDQVTILTRNPGRHRARFPASVRLVSSLEEIASDEVFRGVINLAGEGIADKRWSEKRKQELLDSRTGVTAGLVQLLGRLKTRPEVMISGSAVGYYGAHGDERLGEGAPVQREFSHEICRCWEQAAQPVTEFGVRLCIIRLGLVLGRQGGLLKRLLPPFYLGLGGKIGSGKQGMSWVHLADVLRAIRFLLDQDGCSGVFNLTAPEPLSNLEFSRCLGRAMHRPAVLPLPAFMVKLIFGEMGERLLLRGQFAVPEKLQQAGFRFTHSRLEDAMSEIFSPADDEPARP